MKPTRRELFATIAAAFTAKSAVKPLRSKWQFNWKTLRCECPGCQYARGFLRRGGYEFYPDAFTLRPGDIFTMKSKMVINPES